METASLSGILRTLVTLILIYYAVKFLFRIFAPVLFQQVVKKAGQNFYEQQQQYNQQQQQQYSAPQDKPKEKKKVGEYIDYEEIE
jgi:predicted lipid-binding transport protein (Tim44 family)